MLKHQKQKKFLNTYYTLNKSYKLLLNKNLKVLFKTQFGFKFSYKTLKTKYFKLKINFLKLLEYVHLKKLSKKFKIYYYILNFKLKKNNIFLTLSNFKHKVKLLNSMGKIKIKTKRQKFDFYNINLLGKILAYEFLKQHTKKTNKIIKSFIIKYFITSGIIHKYVLTMFHSFRYFTKLKIIGFFELFKHSHNGLKKSRIKRL